jgi:excisionase family DNA binding protein
VERLIPPAEAARMLGVRLPTVYSWVARRKIPFVKVGAALRFRPSALEAWLRTNEHTGAAGSGRARPGRVRAAHSAMRRRTCLGEWRFPSGQTPPLRPDDLVHYLAVVRPALIRRAQEYLEVPGHVLVLTT